MYLNRKIKPYTGLCEGTEEGVGWSGECDRSFQLRVPVKAQHE